MFDCPKRKMAANFNLSDQDAKDTSLRRFEINFNAICSKYEQAFPEDDIVSMKTGDMWINTGRLYTQKPLEFGSAKLLVTRRRMAKAESVMTADSFDITQTTSNPVGSMSMFSGYLPTGRSFSEKAGDVSRLLSSLCGYESEPSDGETISSGTSSSSYHSNNLNHVDNDDADDERNIDNSDFSDNDCDLDENRDVSTSKSVQRSMETDPNNSYRLNDSETFASPTVEYARNQSIGSCEVANLSRDNIEAMNGLAEEPDGLVHTDHKQERVLKWVTTQTLEDADSEMSPSRHRRKSVSKKAISASEQSPSPCRRNLMSRSIISSSDLSPSRHCHNSTLGSTLNANEDTTSPEKIRKISTRNYFDNGEYNVNKEQNQCKNFHRTFTVSADKDSEQNSVGEDDLSPNRQRDKKEEPVCQRRTLRPTKRPFTPLQPAYTSEQLIEYLQSPLPMSFLEFGSPGHVERDSSCSRVDASRECVTDIECSTDFTKDAFNCKESPATLSTNASYIDRSSTNSDLQMDDWTFYGPRKPSASKSHFSDDVRRAVEKFVSEDNYGRAAEVMMPDLASGNACRTSKSSAISSITQNKFVNNDNVGSTPQDDEITLCNGYGRTLTTSLASPKPLNSHAKASLTSNIVHIKDCRESKKDIFDSLKNSVNQHDNESCEITPCGVRRRLSMAPQAAVANQKAAGETGTNQKKVCERQTCEFQGRDKLFRVGNEKLTKDRREVGKGSAKKISSIGDTTCPERCRSFTVPKEVMKIGDDDHDRLGVIDLKGPRNDKYLSDRLRMPSRTTIAEIKKLTCLRAKSPSSCSASYMDDTLSSLSTEHSSLNLHSLPQKNPVKSVEKKNMDKYLFEPVGQRSKSVREGSTSEDQKLPKEPSSSRKKKYLLEGQTPVDFKGVKEADGSSHDHGSRTSVRTFTKSVMSPNSTSKSVMSPNSTIRSVMSPNSTTKSVMTPNSTIRSVMSTSKSVMSPNSTIKSPSSTSKSVMTPNSTKHSVGEFDLFKVPKAKCRSRKQGSQKTSCFRPSHQEERCDENPPTAVKTATVRPFSLDSAKHKGKALTLIISKDKRTSTPPMRSNGIRLPSTTALATDVGSSPIRSNGQHRGSLFRKPPCRLRPEQRFNEMANKGVDVNTGLVTSTPSKARHTPLLSEVSRIVSHDYDVESASSDDEVQTVCSSFISN